MVSMIHSVTLKEVVRKPELFAYRLEDDGLIPNNPDLALLVYKNTIVNQKDINPDFIEEILNKNNWDNGWRDGIYDFHHYHSTAHECLFVYSGRAHVQFGGEQGVDLEIDSGDMVVLPAGTGHKRLISTIDFHVIGVYPKGQSWDMNYGYEDERPKALFNIKNVPFPLSDPLYGKKGPLMKQWNSRQ